MARHNTTGLAFAATLMASPPAFAAVDLDALWDFANPALSERRFREALATARGDDALILQTQIARSWGLRREPDRARALLKAIEPRLAAAGAEARARHALEWGRSHVCATTLAAERTPAALATARAAYERALAAAQAGQLDGLAVDAMHMMAFVDDAPADQLAWGLKCLAMIEASSQPAAKAWEASIRNNIGSAYHLLGRHGEALPHFERTLALREQGGRARGIHIARWMVARTLRLLGRLDKALAFQLQLEAGAEAALGSADLYVFDELEKIHSAKGDAAGANNYGRRLAEARRGNSKH